MFSIPVLQPLGLTDAERDELSKKVADKNKKSSGGSGKLAALATPAAFVAVHGEPSTWCGAEYDEYLTVCDNQLALQAGVDSDPDTVDFDTATGQAALADIIATLAAEADTDVDIEDLDHYRSLLVTPVTRLTGRRISGEVARGWAA